MRHRKADWVPQRGHCPPRGRRAKSRRLMRLLPFLALLLLPACSNTTLEPQDYVKTCTWDTDCLAVFFGDVCGNCNCPNGAIAADNRYIYEADQTGAERSCGPRQAIGCAECQVVEVACNDGQCSLK